MKLIQLIKNFIFKNEKQDSQKEVNSKSEPENNSDTTDNTDSECDSKSISGGNSEKKQKRKSKMPEKELLPVMDVARFIINYSNERDYSISNLKLQKLLYFVQAYYLTSTEEHEPCFKEDIEAWDF